MLIKVTTTTTTSKATEIVLSAMLCLVLLLLGQNSLDAALRLPALLLLLLPCLSYKCQSAVAAAAAAAPTSPTRHPCPSASLSVRQSKNAVLLGSSSNLGEGGSGGGLYIA